MSVGRIGGVQGGGHDVSSVDEAPAQASPAQASAAQAVRGGAPVRGLQAPQQADEAGDGRLLTKKISGERALMHHLAGRIGPKYEAKVIPGPDRDHYLVKLHRRAPAPPFTTSADPEAVYSVDRRDGKISLVSGAQPPAAPKGTAVKGGVRDLGEVARPGKALSASTQTLRPGETLRFATRENHIYGVGEFRIEPRGGLEVHRKLIDPAVAGRLGAPSLYEYTLKVPADAKPGTTVRVSTGGHFQTRNDPDWAFAFGVSVTPSRG